MFDELHPPQSETDQSPQGRMAKRIKEEFGLDADPKQPLDLDQVLDKVLARSIERNKQEMEAQIAKGKAIFEGICQMISDMNLTSLARWIDVVVVGNLYSVSEQGDWKMYSVAPAKNGDFSMEFGGDVRGKKLSNAFTNAFVDSMQRERDLLTDPQRILEMIEEELKSSGLLDFEIENMRPEFAQKARTIAEEFVEKYGNKPAAQVVIGFDATQNIPFDLDVQRGDIFVNVKNAGLGKVLFNNYIPNGADQAVVQDVINQAREKLSSLSK